MKRTELDKTGIQVSTIGLGGMHLSIQDRPPEEQAIAVIHRALDLGVTFIDTADSYCLDESDKHHNERLIAKALATHPRGDEVKVATKGGLLRPNGDWIVDARPQQLQKTIPESHQALGGEAPIFLWQLHAPDHKVAIEESLQPVRAAVDNGLIRYVGLSNVNVDEIERARKVVDIVSIQNKYNPWHRQPESDGVLEYCEKNKLTFLPWSPLGGSRRVKGLSEINGLKEIANELGVSPMRLILAWLMSKSPCVLPIPGPSRIETLEDSVAATELSLSSEFITQIDDVTKAGSLQS